MSKKPSYKHLKSCLIYYPDTGEFVWKEKIVLRRMDKSWNTRFSGKVAAHIAYCKKAIELHGDFARFA